MSRRLVVLVLTVLASPLVAADIPVTYLVDAKALKSATATTPLTFTLYSDAACTSTVTTQIINAGNLDVIEQLRRLFAKPAPKPPTTARITTKFTGVTTAGNLFLTVTGTGVTAVGGACQAQTAHASGPHLTILPALKLISSGYGNRLDPFDYSPPLNGQCVEVLDRESASVVASLSAGVLHQCDVETTLDSYSNSSSRVNGSACSLAFSISNCTDLPASCDDHIKNQDESDVDCGGSACPKCVGNKACNTSADCYTSCSNNNCTACSAYNAQCGGPCPGCGDYSYCSTSSDCVSNQCGVMLPSGGGCFDYSQRCLPAHCFDNIQDSGETDVDCGGQVCSGCPSGKMCGVAGCDCLAGIYTCNAGVCP